MRTIVRTPANDLEASREFYRKLDFRVLSEDGSAWVTDGKVVVEIDPDPFARPGLVLHAGSWADEVRALGESTAITETDDGHLLSDPGGVWVYLVEGDPKVRFEAEHACFGRLGNFSGISLETTDPRRSVEFWRTLGFSKSMGSLDQGWVALEDEDGMTISLMAPLACPHLFFNPSLTYFNGGENPAVIRGIREAGIPITEEITCFSDDGSVDNVILRDPGGYGIFVFND